MMKSIIGKNYIIYRIKMKVRNDDKKRKSLKSDVR